jgi:transposase
MGEFRFIRHYTKQGGDCTIINIGIDVHKKRCVATLKDSSRQILQQITFDNDADGITEFIDSIKQIHDTARAVCESTANYWIRLHDTLEENGIDTILAHPTKTKIIAQARLKNDKLDSEVLSDLLRSDMICESFVPDKHYRELRNLVRTRLGLIRTRTTYKNKVHSILAKYEYQSPTYKTFSNKGIKWLKEIELSETDRMAMDAYLGTIETTQKQIDTLESKMATLSKDDQRIRLLMTIPGINYITALTVISEIVDIKRFATPDKLVSYAGLAPSQRNSGDTKRTGSITKHGSSWLRYAMVEAAHTAIRNDERINRFYSRIAARRGPQKAKVAAAKEMLVISWHMLTKMEPYRTQNHSLTERKYKRMESKSEST